MNAQGIEAILFDKDGTLFDFHATWSAWARSFLTGVAGGDLVRAAHLGRQIGYDLDSGDFRPDSVAIAAPVDQIAAALIAHMPEFTQETLIDRLNAEAEEAPQVGVVALSPLLDGLAAEGLRLGVCTNDGEAPARAHLKQAGILERFEFIAGYDSGYGAKPDPAPLQAFCAQVGVAPARAVMVGDSRHDLAAGRAAGMRTVAVLTGPAGRADLAPLADVILPDIGHLPGWLAG